MLERLRERVRELREGLEALAAAHREEAEAGLRRAGPAPPRRRAPVYVGPRAEPPEPATSRPVVLEVVVEEPLPPRPLPLRARLRDPRRLRDAFVLREILDPPVAVRRPRRRSFRDR